MKCPRCGGDAFRKGFDNELKSGQRIQRWICKLCKRYFRETYQFNCDHPDCTGVHSSHHWKMLCPRIREQLRNRYATDPEYRERILAYKRVENMTPEQRRHKQARQACRIQVAGVRIQL